ncbi:MAG: hypothetical protein ACFE8L_05245 [Candidatus Hodarchaeota archaeon]
MVKYSINKFLDLRLENDKTNIYVNNELFLQCKSLLLEIPISEIESLEEISSINEVIDKLDKKIGVSANKDDRISPEIQFWGHCSNLQVWYENNYNSCLLHSNLAFPLLKKLTEVGDIIAKNVFKEEIAKRFEGGQLNVMQCLLYNGYLDYLNEDEKEYILGKLSVKLLKILTNEFKGFMNFSLINYSKINIIMELATFIDLKYNKSFLLHIFEKLPKNKKEKFANVVILHLNYKEFKEFKISYGKFYIFFHRILKYFYDKYPKISELLTFLDSGFYNADMSLSEKLAYGTYLF